MSSCFKEKLFFFNEDEIYQNYSLDIVNVVNDLAEKGRFLLEHLHRGPFPATITPVFLWYIVELIVLKG